MHILPEITYIDHHRKSEIERFLNEWYNENDFIVAFSSGSTGPPKSIHLQKQFMNASALKTLRYFELKPSQSAYLALSTETIAGKMMIVRAIVGQLHLIVGPISSDSLLHCEHEIDFAAIVPIQLERTLQEDPSYLKRIKNVLVGGAPLNEKLRTDIISKQLSIYQSYGMTETMSHVAIRKINKRNLLIYNALNGITFSMTSSSELIIHAPDLGIAELKTNDIVELHSPTTFTWIGRSDFVINSGGKKIYPENVERKISDLIQFPFFIHGIPDEHLGTKVVLVIESPIKQTFSKKDFQSILEKHEIPKSLIFVAQFVRTLSEKIDRKASYLQTHVAETVL